ncbi:transmembrane protein, putative [Medicago truncatula]|nr:transmembrane protein, putative [Medicago truncatula]
MNIIQAMQHNFPEQCLYFKSIVTVFLFLVHVTFFKPFGFDFKLRESVVVPTLPNGSFNGGKGGMILQISNLEAWFLILKMYSIGSSNSAGVGWYSGATGMDFNHGNTSPFDFGDRKFFLELMGFDDPILNDGGGVNL